MGLALIGTVSAASVMVNIPSSSVGAGGKATIPVMVTGASNLGAMDITITYDPAILKFSNADLGDLSTNGLVEGNEIQPGTVKISFADTKGISGDGNLIKITFDVVGANGASTNLGASAQAYGLDLKDIPVVSQGGIITVTQPKSPLDPFVAIGALAIIGLIVTLRKTR